MGIIQKAGEINAEGTLVFGKPADGKTSAIIRHIEEREHNPLWIVFSNIDIVSDQHPEWDVAMMPNWNSFKNFFDDIVTGKLDVSEYTCVVIEGLNYASMFLLDIILQKNEMKDVKDPRPAWQEMGRTLMGKISSLRGSFGSLYATCDLTDEEDGTLKLDLNPDLYKKIVSLFGRKWYCYSQPVNPDDISEGLEYIIQTDPTYAIRFKP